MKIINIVDIHGNIKPIDSIGDALASADLVIIAGDLTNFGGEKEAREVLDAVGKYNKNVLAVTGNCDTKEVDEYLDGENINIHGRTVEIDGISITGAGGSLPCPSPTPNVYTEEEYEDIFEGSLRGTDGRPKVLVSHQPPLDTLNDKISNGAHVGSKTVREFIERYQPLVCFTGHIHEAPGIDTIGGTRIVNPGPLGTRSYAFLDVTDGINELEIRKF
ncbi:MAG TPA: metallophosphoesterase family protein [Thermodesulfobacteriota bacterium]|nr:metallophosphoesterase family protein [Thermodesulfobacteriota bacterium]